MISSRPRLIVGENSPRHYHPGCNPRAPFRTAAQQGRVLLFHAVSGTPISCSLTVSGSALFGGHLSSLRTRTMEREGRAWLSHGPGASGDALSGFADLLNVPSGRRMPPTNITADDHLRSFPRPLVWDHFSLVRLASTNPAGRSVLAPRQGNCLSHFVWQLKWWGQVLAVSDNGRRRRRKLARRAASE